MNREAAAVMAALGCLFVPGCPCGDGLPEPVQPKTRSSAVAGWALPASDELRAVVIRRLLDSSCAESFRPEWPLCIHVEEPLPQPSSLDGVFVPPVDLGYASSDLVARVKRSRPTVLSAEECIDLPGATPRMVVVLHPFRRWWKGDAEVMVHATMGSPYREAPLQSLELEATAVMERSGWVLSASRVELEDFTPRNRRDRRGPKTECN
jgi:hypothetical protein